MNIKLLTALADMLHERQGDYKNYLVTFNDGSSIEVAQSSKSKVRTFIERYFDQPIAKIDCLGIFRGED